MDNDFREITLEDQGLFEKAFALGEPVSSELTFTYLFMWRKDYGLRYTVEGNYICMVSFSRTHSPFAFFPMPLDGKCNKTGLKAALDRIEAFFKEQGAELVYGRVEEEKAHVLEEIYGERAQSENLDSIADYVYQYEDLARLAGRKFSSKRNHISQFMRRYESFEYVPVDENNLHECRRIMESWSDVHEKDVAHPDNSERVAFCELAKNWSRFPVKGALIRIDGKYEAFTVGEKLNSETVVIRIEKGNAEIHGIYTLINKEFLDRDWQGMKWINREEDMGMEGLRKSKLSYNPDHMVRKFLVKVLH